MIMGTITEIFRAVGPEYLERFPELPLDHKKTIRAIINCRAGDFGQVVYQCQECGQRIWPHRRTRRPTYRSPSAACAGASCCISSV